MKKTLVFTLMVFLAIATASQGQTCVTIDFEDIATGTSVMGPGAVSDLLSISGTNLQVVEEGQSSGLLAYNSHGLPDGRNWLPGDNIKSFGNDAFTDQSPTAENLRIDFNPEIIVSYFEIQMFDYGDWFPLGGSNPREATLKAYDSSDVELDSLTLSTTLQNPGNDVTLGGVHTLSVSGDNIAYVELTFADVDPGISYDNITICYQREYCETAFAYGDGAMCFLDIEDLGSERWGWTIGLDEAGEYEVDLYAAAGQCDTEKGMLVGTATIDYSGGTVTVDIELDGDYTLYESHIYAGTSEVPLDKKGNPTVAPGQYYIEDDLEGPIYVIVHAVVCWLE